MSGQRKTMSISPREEATKLISSLLTKLEVFEHNFHRADCGCSIVIDSVTTSYAVPTWSLKDATGEGWDLNTNSGC